MVLDSGKHLGPYEILSPIGAGGMGEVYKANDTRLDRTVAIKVLPDHLAKDPELRERFEREARAVSSLNHPHICTLHDIGQHNGIDFMVMEFIEGETLTDRLKNWALPLDQALEYAIQIADALDKAHRQGVVHRDLKPGNVMLTKQGVKLLDFGLAKLTGSLSSEGGGLGWGDSDDSGQPTQQKPLTNAGAVLGTVQYMAPEQLEGKEADVRADIFAFGAVLYEMVTGRRAFEGESQASLTGAILKDDPPLVSELRPMTPRVLDRLVAKCLAKDPEDRCQTARDVTTELQWISRGETSRPSAADPVAASGKGRHRLLWIAAAVAVALAVAAGISGYLGRSSTSSSPHMRLAITLPPPHSLAIGRGQPGVTISPDGTKIVFVGLREGIPHLFLRHLDSFEATPIPGTEGASFPFFSPDGQWVGFFADPMVKKVFLSGGAPEPLISTQGIYFAGGSWEADDTVFLGAWDSGLLRVSANGGVPEPVTRLNPDEGERGHAFPDILPGGKAVVFTIWDGHPADESPIVVESLETGERRVLLQGYYARYLPTGHLIYVTRGVPMAVPFDLGRLEVTGPSVPVLDGVMVNSAIWYGEFNASMNGSLVYVPGGSMITERTLALVGAGGEERPLEEGAFESVRLSPDARRLAVKFRPDLADVWIYEIARDILTRLTFDGDSHSQIWTPDGTRVVFTSSREGYHNLYWKAVDGSGKAERLTSAPQNQVPGSCSPDGRLLAYGEADPNEGWNIWMLPLEREGEREPRPFLQTTYNEQMPMFSPDGRWLAYVSDESGRYEVYIQPYPGPGAKVQISTEGGTQPVWASSGRELFYRSREKKIMSVSLDLDGDFQVGVPRLRVLGSIASATYLSVAQYDVMPDGQRFVVIRESDTYTAPREVRVVLNWFEELRRLVPTEN